MSAQNTGECLFTFKRYPRELTAVVIQETGSKTDTSSGSYVGESRVMIRAVKILDLPGTDHPVLDSLQGSG